MAAHMRRLIERARGPLPVRPERYRVFELVAWSKSRAPELEPAVWAVALDHEGRAMEAAALEPGALDAVAGARRAGFQTALWTNNARAVTLPALERLGLAALLDLVVTRDDMSALKPDPDGWRVISERFADTRDAVVVGDSWVDGVAAAAVGVPFVAYRAHAADLTRPGVTPVAWLADLARLPQWLPTPLRRHQPARPAPSAPTPTRRPPPAPPAPPAPPPARYAPPRSP